ncbi:Amine oxidase [Gracilaria domingensis]|nr:Amine oxidase [Gracilaria domingensis]
MSRSSFITPAPFRAAKSPFQGSVHQHPVHDVTRYRVPRMRDSSMHHGSTHDIIIIGTGFGALSAASVLTAYGFKPLLLESHYAPGGVAHGFSVRNGAGNFHFDTGPSFFCDLDSKMSSNPLKQALDAVGEHIKCVSYPSFCIDDVRVGTVTVSSDEEDVLKHVHRLGGGDAAAQLRSFYQVMRRIHSAMNVPAVALRGDWKVMPIIFRRWATDMMALLPYVKDVTKPVGDIMRRVGVTNPFVKRILDTEAFLLSGLKTDSTITAEIAFMIGERSKRNAMQYPIGGVRSIVRAFVRGIERKGGTVRLNSHVERILVEDGVAVGVDLRSGERIFAKHIFSNASLWNTVKHLLPQNSLPVAYRTNALKTPMVESFMHAHMAIPSEGLEHIIGHHAVIIDSEKDIALPGNTVMISIPTMWSPDLAPDGWHIIHCYTLEKYDRWPDLRGDRRLYEAAKEEASQPLFKAVRHVIPDLDERLKHEHAFFKLGSPLTHERFNRRYKGTYGAAIVAGKAEFEWPDDIPIKNLKRCGDSVFPGIGVPSSAAAGIIAANELVGIQEHSELVDKIIPR